MLTDTDLLANCKRMIEQKLDWGNSEHWQTADFESLQQRILDETGVSLSSSTLRRLWGRARYEHLPSVTTLNTLAQFAGFENWRAFAKQSEKNSSHSIRETSSPNETSSPEIGKPARRRRVLAIGGGIILFVLFCIFALQWTGRKANEAIYHFSGELVTREIPNSVVFTYDATASPTDSVYIQQSWDPRRKEAVNKAMHKHTSVYYEPGFYQAKLLVGNKVVKEHPLLIPTEGWLGTITTNNAVPVYLKSEKIMDRDTMRVRVSSFSENNIPMQPTVPWIKFYNVGGFDPIPVTDFSFSTEVKNEYAEGAAACQLTYVSVITEAGPIAIPLSTKGCISELNLMGIDQMVSGKKADLSGFGVDFSNWVKVECKSASDSIYYYINEKLVYQSPLPKKPTTIVGISYSFQGTGAVKNILLSNKKGLVLKEF